MKIAIRSIKGKLFVWFFAFSSVLLIILGFSLYHKFKETIFSSVDNALHSKLQILKGLLHEEHDSIEFELDEVVLGEYSIPRSGHYYKIIMNGEVEFISESLVDDDFDLASGRLESYDEELMEKIYTSTGPADEPIRVLQHDFEFLNIPTSVFVAESISENLSMLNSIKLFFFIITPSSIFILGIVGLLIAEQSLKPLKKFSSAIETITHKTLSKRILSAVEAEELRSLADSFNAMLDRLQNAFDAEKRLVADASHELKTPLSVIKAQCEVLLQKDRAKEEYIEAFETIKHSVESLNKLLNDLMSLSRLDSGILSAADFEIVPVNDCIKNAIHLVKVLAEEKNIHISIDTKENITIPGNKDRITEALLNIIENAVRYNKTGGSVEVSAFKDNTRAEITIKDTGIGIKNNDLKKIFERFYRADASRSTEGTGLGLSIADTIVKAHSGSISVKSKPGEGSSFVITLPSGNTG